MSSKTEELKAARVDDLMNKRGYTMVHFKGGDFMSGPGTNGFIPFDSRIFARLVQKQVPGTTDNMTRDLEKTVRVMAPDWSAQDRYVFFADRVWDRVDLRFVDEMRVFYATSISLNSNTAPAKKFLLQLSKGDENLAYDYLQCMAPLFMMDRPTGIIWFVGDGANGKSALLKALYLGFKKHFASMTVADLEDGRDIPSLRGKLGNIVLESSEARVEDSKAYKSIGSHEDLTVHLFNQQSRAEVEVSFHTIFNANNIPTFADKTGAIKRRTWTIPFPAHFEDNPTFERDTFTPDFLGGMFQLILDTAVEIRDNGNKYRWSDATIAVKKQYDEQVNSAEAFIHHLTELHIQGVYNYHFLENNYRDWCSKEGHIPLSIQTLKRSVGNILGVNNKVLRIDNKSYRRLVFNEAYASDDPLVWEDGSGYGVATPKIIETQQLDKSW